MSGQEFIIGLQSQLESFKQAVEELKAENAKLLSKLSDCKCRFLEKNGDFDIVKGEEGVSSKLNGFPEKSRNGKSVLNNPPGTKNTVHHCSKRYVALKVMYFGKRFYGFASEAHMEPTVESEVFKALEKTRLLLGGKKEIQYSRCGRTDKGVSSVGQVITLFIRSKLGKTENCNGDHRKVIPEDEYEGEIDYVRVLNGVLPNDVRIMGWSPAPISLNARFNCLSREYKYFFWGRDLNIKTMEHAAMKFVGEHDFRNFCKMDAANVHNFKRIIYSFEISPCIIRFPGNELWSLKIKGSAFLWHQVRCMVAVLFMIGQGLEAPDVIDTLLDIDQVKKKPQYIIAPDKPLVLQSCEFQNLRFICSSDARGDLTAKLVNEFRNYLLDAAIVQEAMLASVYVENDDLSKINGNIKGTCHVHLLSRPCEPSYEERCARLKTRLKAKAHD